MASDFIYDPRARKLLGLPPLGIGAGGSFGGGGASYPNRSSGIPLRRSYTNADLPPPTDEFNAFSPEALDPLGMNKPRVPSIMDAAADQAPAPMPTPDPQPAPPPTPPMRAPAATLAAAAAPAGGAPLDMTGSVRGVLPGAGTFGIVPPEETRGVEVGRSDAGTPAAGAWLSRTSGLPGLLNRTSEYPTPPPPAAAGGDDSWMGRRHGLPGLLNTVGDYEREARTAGLESIEGARDMLGGGARAVGNWFAGRPQETAVASSTPGAPPAPASTATQRTVLAASGAPKAAPGSVAEAAAARGRGAQPVATPAPPSPMGPPEELSGVPTYTNADLDRVRESGPMRGGYVQGSIESLPLNEQIQRASGERTLADIKAMGTGLTPSMKRELEYKRQEGDIRFAAMDGLIDAEAEREIAELMGDPKYSPQQKKQGVDEIRQNALQQKLWSRRLGVAGWPRTGVDTYDPATGEPLYGPSTVQPPG